MQREGRHEKEKDEDDAHVGEKLQDNSAKILFIYREQVCDPPRPGVPKCQRHDQEEEGEEQADDERTKEEVPEKNNLFGFHICDDETVFPKLKQIRNPNRWLIRTFRSGAREDGQGESK